MTDADADLTWECDECGACCKTLIVEIGHIDVVREPRLLAGVARLLDGRGTIAFGSDWEKQYMLACGKPCPMLRPDNRCDIYPTRPNCCVAFEPGPGQCEDARRRAGLPPLQPKPKPWNDPLRRPGRPLEAPDR